MCTCSDIPDHMSRQTVQSCPVKSNKLTLSFARTCTLPRRTMVEMKRIPQEMNTSKLSPIFSHYFKSTPLLSSLQFPPIYATSSVIRDKREVKSRQRPFFTTEVITWEKIILITIHMPRGILLLVNDIKLILHFFYKQKLMFTMR